MAIDASEVMATAPQGLPDPLSYGSAVVLDLPPDVLREVPPPGADLHGVADELLNITRLRQLGVELTTTCNLACVYCHFAPLTRRGKDADQGTVENLIDFVKQFPVDYVTLSGDAEITMYKGWDEVARRMLAANIELRTISNFSKGIFSEAEIDVFSQFREILISLDTCDAALLKKIRYRADLRTITTNMQLVRTRAIQTGRRMPHFVCNVVTHDINIGLADQTAAFALACGFAQLNFVRFVELEEVSGGKNDLRDNPNAQQVRRIRELDLPGAAKAVRALQRAVEICKDKIALHIQPGIVDEINLIINPETAGAPKASTLAPGQIRTKQCLMPWDFFYVLWNGDVPPCCIVKDTMIGNVATKPLIDVINGDGIKEYRAGLLTGNLKPECQTCTYVPDTDTQTLTAHVRNYLSAYGKGAVAA